MALSVMVDSELHLPPGRIQVRPSKKKCSGSQTMDFKKRAR
jgi:hypothetical protein